LARQIDVPVNRVTGIVNGQRSITVDTALRLGHWFGISPEFWLNLQKLYELRMARQEIGETREEASPAHGTQAESRAYAWPILRPLHAAQLAVDSYAMRSSGTLSASAIFFKAAVVPFLRPLSKSEI